MTDFILPRYGKGLFEVDCLNGLVAEWASIVEDLQPCGRGSMTWLP